GDGPRLDVGLWVRRRSGSTPPSSASTWTRMQDSARPLRTPRATVPDREGCRSRLQASVPKSRGVWTRRRERPSRRPLKAGRSARTWAGGPVRGLGRTAGREGTGALANCLKGCFHGGSSHFLISTGEGFDEDESAYVPPVSLPGCWSHAP